MPSIVRKAISAIISKAPELPADTTASAVPSLTSSIASRMDDLLPERKACEGTSSDATLSVVW